MIRVGQELRGAESVQKVRAGRGLGDSFGVGPQVAQGRRQGLREVILPR